MTGMQLIVPPLEEHSTSQGDVTSEEEEDQHGFAEQSNRNHHDNEGSSSVLPVELRENFEDMKAVWRQARRGEAEGEHNSEELRRKERETAVVTAVAVDAEISRWQKGIAELEAMLASQEEEEDGDEDVEDGDEPNAHPQPQFFVRFPSLPPVVPLEDYDTSDDSTSSSGEHPGSTATMES